MKRTILFVTSLVFIMSCSKEFTINMDKMLIERDGIYYTKDTDEPYSGLVFSSYQRGRKSGEGTLKNGKKDGLWTHWYYNGLKEREGTYIDGIEEGYWTEWFENGQKWSEGALKNGKREGRWIDWSTEDGKSKKVMTYKDGKLSIFYGMELPEFKWNDEKPKKGDSKLLEEPKKDELKKRIKKEIISQYDFEEKFGEFKGILKTKSIYKYDSKGNMVEESYYDSDGNLIGDYELPIGVSKTLYKYDSNGNMVEKSYYDSDGNLTGDVFGVNKTIYQYDYKGNMVEESKYYSDGSLTTKTLYKLKIK